MQTAQAVAGKLQGKQVPFCAAAATAAGGGTLPVKQQLYVEVPMYCPGFTGQAVEGTTPGSVGRAHKESSCIAVSNRLCQSVWFPQCQTSGNINFCALQCLTTSCFCITSGKGVLDVPITYCAAATSKYTLLGIVWSCQNQINSVALVMHMTSVDRSTKLTWSRHCLSWYSVFHAIQDFEKR